MFRRTKRRVRGMIAVSTLGLLLAGPTLVGPWTYGLPNAIVKAPLTLTLIIQRDAGELPTQALPETDNQTAEDDE